MASMPRAALLASAIAALLCACVTTTNVSSPSREANTGPWLAASPSLRQEIDDNVKRLPWTHGLERVELIRWFASVGEPAYAKLLELCLDPRAEVAGSALAALGATGDKRLVDALHALGWPTDLPHELRFERARTYVRLGDWSDVDVLIAGLREQDTFTRALCAKSLLEATGERMGFDPHGPADEREAAVKRWEEWLAQRRGEGILASASN